MLKLNLLPWRKIQSRFRSQLFLCLSLQFVLVVGGLFAVFFSKHQKTYQQLLVNYSDLQVEHAEKKEKLQEMASFFQSEEWFHRKNVRNSFDDIAESLPRDTVLLRVFYKTAYWELEGLAENTEALQDFMRLLAKKKCFQKPFLLDVEARGAIIFKLALEENR